MNDDVIRWTYATTTTDSKLHYEVYDKNSTGSSAYITINSWGDTVIFGTQFNGQGIRVNYRFQVNKRIISKKFVPTTEERMEEYIQDNYDRYMINEYGSYIYQMIQEKAYDLASELVEEAKEDYIIDNEEQVIESILEEIDFDSLYDLIEDILNAPITMEEKLADIGMSMRDFL